MPKHHDFPHNPLCHCSSCTLHPHDLEYEKERVFLYDAMASKATRDAIFEDQFKSAVTHLADLKKAAGTQNVFRTTYVKLEGQMKSQVVEMMNESRDPVELFSDRGEHDGEPVLARQLVDLNISECVNHFRVKFWMQKHWRCGPDTPKGPGTTSHQVELPFFTALLLSILAPVVPLILARRFAYSNTPFFRWVAGLSSHVVFLGLVIFRLFWDEDKSSMRNTRLEYTFYLDFVIFVFVLSNLILLQARLVRRGLKSFMCDWWNWIETLIGINGVNFFVASCYVKIELVTGLPSLVNRRHLPPTDHVLMAEASLAMLTLLLVVRFAYHLQLSHSLGKFIVAVTQCAADYMKFLVLLVVLCSGFGLGLYGILHPFSATDEEKSGEFIKNNGFQVYSGNLAEAMSNFFWNVFGLIDEGYSQAHAGFAGPNQESVNPVMTMIVARIILSAFFLTVVVALLNIMLSILVARLEAAKTTDEWSFYRTKVILDYFNWEMSYIPPYSLLIPFRSLCVKTPPDEKTPKVCP
ncbi:unnamed protein product, partial [Mesorhabditis spiculigera]